MSTYIRTDIFELKTSFDKKGQMVAKDLLPLTPVEEACKAVLVKHYEQAKGNISLTARSMGWPRTKTLKMLHAYNLYNKYPHEPGPIAKEK